MTKEFSSSEIGRSGEGECFMWRAKDGSDREEKQTEA